VAVPSEALAITIEQQCRDVVEFFSGLNEAELRAPCGDPSGDTVAAVLDHLGDGYGEVVGWLCEVAGAPAPATAAVAGDHAHGPAAAVERIASGASLLAGTVRGLSQRQLDLVPPAKPGFTDGSKRLSEVIGGMIGHQTAHVDYVKQAVSAADAVQRSR